MRLTAIIFVSLGATISLLAQSAVPARETNLTGTWRLVEMSIDRFNPQAAGGIEIETQRPVPETFFEESRTIEIDGDIVTVHGKGRKGFLPPPISNDQYRLDGQPHTFEWGDIPRQTAVRIGRWLADVDGFELIDNGGTHRWTVSPNGLALTVETSDGRTCPPCGPGFPIRQVEVFLRER
jgi:hypothetical protein